MGPWPVPSKFTYLESSLEAQADGRQRGARSGGGEPELAQVTLEGPVHVDGLLPLSARLLHVPEDLAS